MNQKHKRAAETADELVYNSDGFEDDDDIPENVHSRLLGAVSKLYKKKRVEAPTRKEPTLEVSEFHLTSARDQKKKKNGVDVSNLTKVLDKKATHKDIKQQVNRVKTSKRLDKPIERLEAEKVERVVGYENLKKDLGKWNAIVHHQRAAEQVSFPLPKAYQIESLDDSEAFLSKFRTPTLLEQQMAEILKASREYRKKDVDEDKAVAREAPIPLTLKEMMEQRALMARTRAQRRYKETKAARQNKIKSKKYHRIQRKEKIKAELKEFEELQKKDPEAALKKLEKLEKARAQERASLRHRTTGHWAKNLQVRAKYDKEARIALAEQLQKSRELTRRLKEHSSSDEEFDEDEGSDSESRIIPIKNTEKSKSSKQDFDDMFYKVEDKLNEQVGKRVEILKKQVDSLDVSLKQVGTPSNNRKSDEDDLGAGFAMKRKLKTSEIDEALDETTSKESTVQSSIGRWTVQQVALTVDPISSAIEKQDESKTTDIEPVKTLQVKPKFLKTLVPTDLAGGEDLDDDDDNANDAGNGEAHLHNLTIAEAFADDDVVREFQSEKDDEIKKSKIEDVNLALPGWGSWGGHNIKENKRKREKFIVKFPEALPRRDENKGNVVINEDNDVSVKPLLVSEVPFPFTSVKDFEASIRAPIGSTFLPQTAFRKLIAPSVKTKMGTIIEPMSGDHVVKSMNPQNE